MVQKMDFIWTMFEIKMEGYLAHGDHPSMLTESAPIQVAQQMAYKT